MLEAIQRAADLLEEIGWAVQPLGWPHPQFPGRDLRYLRWACHSYAVAPTPNRAYYQK